MPVVVRRPRSRRRPQKSHRAPTGMESAAVGCSRGALLRKFSTARWRPGPRSQHREGAWTWHRIRPSSQHDNEERSWRGWKWRAPISLFASHGGRGRRHATARCGYRDRHFAGCISSPTGGGRSVVGAAGAPGFLDGCARASAHFRRGRTSRWYGPAGRCCVWNCAGVHRSAGWRSPSPTLRRRCGFCCRWSAGSAGNVSAGHLMSLIGPSLADSFVRPGHEARRTVPHGARHPDGGIVIGASRALSSSVTPTAPSSPCLTRRAATSFSVLKSTAPTRCAAGRRRAPLRPFLAGLLSCARHLTDCGLRVIGAG